MPSKNASPRLTGYASAACRQCENITIMPTVKRYSPLIMIKLDGLDQFGLGHGFAPPRVVPL